MELLEIGKIITEDELNELETKLKLKFPMEYKAFLETNNGGMPKVEVGFHFTEKNIETQETWEQGSDIHYFYSVDEMLEAYDNLVYESSIPNDYIPIACDSFGNNVLLCLNIQKNYGGVFFANHEIENVDNTFGNLSFVSNSFNEFMDSLKEINFD